MQRIEATHLVTGDPGVPNPPASLELKRFTPDVMLRFTVVTGTPLRAVPTDMMEAMSAGERAPPAALPAAAAGGGEGLCAL